MPIRELFARSLRPLLVHVPVREQEQGSMPCYATRTGTIIESALQQAVVCKYRDPYPVGIFETDDSSMLSSHLAGLLDCFQTAFKKLVCFPASRAGEPWHLRPSPFANGTRLMFNIGCAPDSPLTVRRWAGHRSYHTTTRRCSTRATLTAAHSSPCRVLHAKIG